MVFCRGNGPPATGINVSVSADAQIGAVHVRVCSIVMDRVVGQHCTQLVLFHSVHIVDMYDAGDPTIPTLGQRKLSSNPVWCDATVGIGVGDPKSGGRRLRETREDLGSSESARGAG